MNGWSNRSTWLISLWGFGDIEQDHPVVRSIIGDEDMTFDEKVDRLAEIIKSAFNEFLDEMYPNLSNGADVVADLIAASLEEINWFELAEVWHKDNV